MEQHILAAFLAGVVAFYAWRAIVNNRKVCMYAAFDLSTASYIPCSQLRSIPSVGPDGLLTSFTSALHFLKHAHEMGQEGYNKVSPMNKICCFFKSHSLYAVPRVFFQSAHDVSMDGRGIWNALY